MHASLEGVSWGPRREAEFVLHRLVRDVGPRLKYADPVVVRLGGVINDDESLRFLQSLDYPVELTYFRYARYRKSKPGHFYVEMLLERREGHHLFECGSVQLSESDDHP